MSRYQRYIDTDVLTEARKRLRHIYDLHDSVVVAFSGGKDSLAVLHLTREIAAEYGRDHVDVVFRDEELIPDPVIDFVNEYRQLPWVRMTWYAVPLISEKFVLGRTARYLQWDPDREHLRPIPEWATTLDDLGLPPGTTMSQYDMDAITAAPFPGKVAIVTGIRAAESLARRRASVNKLNDNYINASSTKKATLCKPIFDWQENDVFRWFYDQGIRYCPLYDAQIAAGAKLRVATPLLADGAKKFGSLRAIAPTFYDQVLDLFPDMAVQERYWSEFDVDAARAEYAGSWDGIARWVEDNIDDPDQHALAVKRLRDARRYAEAAPDSYPLDYVLNEFVIGAYKRKIQPLSPDKRRKGTR